MLSSQVCATLALPARGGHLSSIPRTRETLERGHLEVGVDTGRACLLEEDWHGQVPRDHCVFLGAGTCWGRGGKMASLRRLSPAPTCSDCMSSVVGVWLSFSCWCSASASWWPVSCTYTSPGSRYMCVCALYLHVIWSRYECVCVLYLRITWTGKRWPLAALLAGQVGAVEAVCPLASLAGEELSVWQEHIQPVACRCCLWSFSGVPRGHKGGGQ